MRCLLLALMIIISAEQVKSGAWPREDGQVFLSYASHISQDELGYLRYSQELYAEYGLSSQYTVIIDAFQNDIGTNGRFSASLQRSLSSLQDRQHFVVAAGIGYDLYHDATTLRLGGSWGIGFDRSWVNLDAHIDIFQDTDLTEAKLESTIGWRQSTGDLVLFRITAEHLPQSQDSIWLSPAYVWRASSRTSLEIGLGHEALHANDYRLKIGVWSEF